MSGKTSIDPLELNQWKIYVVAAKTLDEELGDQGSLALSTLGKLGPAVVNYTGLAEAVEAAAQC